MEDIDKNGDGFIDLQEYIGEFTLTFNQVLLSSFVWISSTKVSLEFQRE